MPNSRQKRFVLVLTDYFTKWIKAEAFANITEKRGSTVRMEEHHLSPWLALRYSDRQWLPVHIKQVPIILREVEDARQYIKSEIPSEYWSSRGVQQDNNRQTKETPRLEKGILG